MEEGAKGFDINGVAPEASLYVYRVAGCDRRGTADAILKGLSKAHEDEVDIVNMSLGWLSYYDPFEKATKALTEAGIIVVAAVGDDAHQVRGSPLYTGSPPAMDPNVVAVGSVVNTHFPTVYAALDLVNTISYASLYPLDIIGDADVWFFEDPCDSSEWNHALDTTREKIRTTIFAYQTSKSSEDCLHKSGPPPYFWASHEPRYIMEIRPNSSNPFNNLTFDPYESSYIPSKTIKKSIQFISVSLADGEKLHREYVRSGGYMMYKLWFTYKKLRSAPNPAGGMMDSTSSFGPTYGNPQLKPQLSAPGGAILSTLPMGTDGGYGIMSGTSMAASYVAGCFALLKRKFPKETQGELLSRLQVSAKPVSWAYNSSILATTLQQGAGLINAYDAMFAKTKISPSQLVIEDTGPIKYGTANITIKNTSKEPQVYVFSHKPAGWMNRQWSGDPEQYPIFGKVELDPHFYPANTTKVQVYPGLSTVLHVAFFPPTEHPAKSNPGYPARAYFSGFLVVTSIATDQTFHIPYIMTLSEHWPS
jgi:subtilisin family serine protease